MDERIDGGIKPIKEMLFANKKVLFICIFLFNASIEKQGRIHDIISRVQDGRDSGIVATQCRPKIGTL